MMRARKSMSPLRIMMMILITALFMLWLVIPFILTVLWSLVDKTHPWAWPDALPPVLSWAAGSKSGRPRPCRRR